MNGLSHESMPKSEVTCPGSSSSSLIFGYGGVLLQVRAVIINLYVRRKEVKDLSSDAAMFLAPARKMERPAKAQSPLRRAGPTGNRSNEKDFFAARLKRAAGRKGSPSASSPAQERKGDAISIEKELQVSRKEGIFLNQEMREDTLPIEVEQTLSLETGSDNEETPETVPAVGLIEDGQPVFTVSLMGMPITGQVVGAEDELSPYRSDPLMNRGAEAQVRAEELVTVPGVLPSETKEASVTAVVMADEEPRSSGLRSDRSAAEPMENETVRASIISGKEHFNSDPPSQPGTVPTHQGSGRTETQSESSADVRHLMEFENGRLQGRKLEAVPGQDPQLNSDLPVTKENQVLEVKFTPIREMFRAQVEPEDFMEQMIKKLDVMVKENQSQMKIILKPEFLGRMTIKLAMENGLVTARFMAENYQVKQLLEASLPQLRASLESNGIRLDRAEVNLLQQPAHDFSGQSSFEREQTTPQSRTGGFIPGRLAGEELAAGAEVESAYYPGSWGGQVDYVV